VNDVTQQPWQLRMAFSAAPMANGSNFWRTNWLYVRHGGKRSVSLRLLPSSKSIMGLAWIERAKPLFVQTLDVRRSFYYGTRTAVPTLTPMPAGGLGEEISRVQTCCAPGPTYILKVGDMPGPGVRVPVQSAATV
jgi:hypothetical protein